MLVRTTMLLLLKGQRLGRPSVTVSVKPQTSGRCTNGIFYPKQLYTIGRGGRGRLDTPPVRFLTISVFWVEFPGGAAFVFFMFGRVKNRLVRTYGRSKFVRVVFAPLSGHHFQLTRRVSKHASRRCL